MSFAQFPQNIEAVQLLQRSLERGRLGHAYLFVGSRSETLEALARTLAKVLNCQQRVGAKPPGAPPDCCDRCENCRKIGADTHPDVLWLRPESKQRQIRIAQVRDLMHTVSLKPTAAAFKVGVIAGADRMTEEAANAFLKTLEEPPPRSVLLLLTADPSFLLETIRSRCLRLNLAEPEGPLVDPATRAWLEQFAEAAVLERGSLLSRYRVLAVLLKKLGDIRTAIEQRLAGQSPLEQFDEVEPEVLETWEEQFKAAVESEYRRQRAGLLAALQWWLRDVWLHTLRAAGPPAAFPDLAEAARTVAQRLSAHAAAENLRVMERLQRLLATNVQEALTLEVGFLKLKL